MDPTSPIPARYEAAVVEKRHIATWEASGVYRYDPGLPRQATFAIDTPPPTVSGRLHVGHAFSYAHTDFIARYQRMRGKNVFYPMGWDDNGLPTERRVQNLCNVSCTPTLPYEGPLELESLKAKGSSGPTWVPGRSGPATAPAGQPERKPHPEGLRLAFDRPGGDGGAYR